MCSTLKYPTRWSQWRGVIGSLGRSTIEWFISTLTVPDDSLDGGFCAS